MSRNFATAESIGKIKSRSFNNKYGPKWLRPKGKYMASDEIKTEAGEEKPETAGEQKAAE